MRGGEMNWPDDIPMPEAVREYGTARRGNVKHTGLDIDIDWIEAVKADAAIAALVEMVINARRFGDEFYQRAEQTEQLLEDATDQGLAACQLLEQAEADARGWAESFKMAEQSIVDLQAEVVHWKGHYEDCLKANREAVAEVEKLRRITVKGVPAGVDVALYYDRWVASQTEVARLTADFEKLKWCATCDHFYRFGSAVYCSIECPERIHAYDHQRPYESPCQYEPSKWTNGDLVARWEAEHGS
jgi:hypothetical protein